jgi:RecB family exonuclease
VCIVGCEEGELPARTATARLLDGASRAAAGLEAPDAFATVVRDRRRLALCRAAAATCVGVIVAHDDSGRARSASRFVDPAAPRVRLGALPGAPLPPELAAAAFVSAEERAWVLLADAEEAAADRLFGELGLARGAKAARERGLRRFGAYSGEISEGDLAGVLSDRILSPTRLEAYAVCPFRFFATSLLACDVLEEPEARLSIDARDRGTLVHEVLQRFVAGQIAAPEDPNAASAERLRELADEVCERYRRLGRTGKDVLWAAERRRILEWLERERVSDAERRAGGARPLAVEHRFGTSPADALVRVVGGVQMRFRGAIDRVDAEPGGGLRVIDYKTGRGAGYRAIADDPLGRGRFLQLPLYALAARQAFGATAATAAYRLVGDEPGEVAVHLGPETEERLDAVLATLVGAIRNGMFPHRPGPRRRGVHENCEYCDFDALCPSERAGLWEGARAEEALSGYVALVEGADMAGGDDER